MRTSCRNVKRQFVDGDAVRDGQVVNALVGGLVRQKLPQHDTVAGNNYIILRCLFMIRSCQIIIVKMGQPLSIFIIFVLFKDKLSTEKTVDFSGIRTRIVGI